MEESPKSLLVRHGLRAKHSFGQNFLADAHWTERIAELAASPGGGTVVEIGAGLGHLTSRLLTRAARVVAIERDRDLLPILRERFAEHLEERLTLLEADAKTVAYAELFAAAPRPHVLAGNLPYSIVGPLLQLATGLAAELDKVVFLVQLEVAERLAAAPASSEYGALSVFVQARFQVTRAHVIRRGAFFPQPGVDSALVVLKPHATALAEEDAVFRALVRGAFAQRRKTLRNAWRGVLGLSPAALELAAGAAGIDLDLRGECLAVQAFAKMAAEVRT